MENTEISNDGRRLFFSKKRIRFLAAAIFLSAFIFCTTCSAETVDLADADFRFVDALDETGYYVDVNTIEFHGDREAKANVAMIRADLNRLYLYDMRFDKSARTYQILSSIVADYDTKKKTGGSLIPTKPLRYGKNSPMESVAEFIFSRPAKSE